MNNVQTNLCSAASSGNFVSLAIFAFCSLGFCFQINAMEFIFPLANEKRKKKHARCPVYLAGKESQDL